MTAIGNLQRAAEKTRQIKQNISCSEADPKVRERRIELAVAEERQNRLRRGSKGLQTTRLSVDMLERAEAALIRYEQCSYFTEEIKTLDKEDSADSQRLKRSSKLYKLDPFMTDNLLRWEVGWRERNCRTMRNIL